MSGNNASRGLKRPPVSSSHATNLKLTKPFRSPLVRKYPSSESSSSQPTAADGASARTAASLASPEERDAHHDTVPVSQALNSPNIDTTHDAVTSDVLYKQYLDLSRQLTQMRQSLDTAQQALNILQADQQHAMQSLIHKWTGVVRDTAEELFEDIKLRSQVEGRFARSRRCSPSYHGESDERNQALTKDQKEMLLAQQEEDHAQALKYGVVESIEDRADDPEPPVSLDIGISLNPLIHFQTFTMATMLRQMDVDLDLVGYDEKEERFIT